MTPMRRLAEAEVELAAACAALATRLGDPTGELTALVDEHLLTASRLTPDNGGSERSLTTSLRQMALAATTVARGELGALEWLRAREHQLVRAYLALEVAEGLDEPLRRVLRRSLLPAAFARFTRVDRMIAAYELEEGALA